MLLELDNHGGENNSRILPASENHPPVVGETFTTDGSIRDRVCEQLFAMFFGFTIHGEIKHSINYPIAPVPLLRIFSAER